MVLRLASLLGRMRRATAVETGLLQIQAEILSDRRYECEAGDDTAQKPQSVFLLRPSASNWSNPTQALGERFKSC